MGMFDKVKRWKFSIKWTPAQNVAMFNDHVRASREATVLLNITSQDQQGVTYVTYQKKYNPCVDVEWLGHDEGQGYFLYRAREENRK